MDRKINVYEVTLDEANQNSGVYAISLVGSPAIDLDFIALKKEQKSIKLADEDRRVLMGAALVPNKPIYRKMGDEEFYILFSKETIRRASELYFIRNNQQNATLEHEEKVGGLTTVESWIVEDKDKDKSNLFGFDVPLGTWMVSMKVDNEDVWTNLVKTGDVKGFSIEGFFMPELRENLSKQKDILNKTEYFVDTESDEYKKIQEVKRLLNLI